jgi:nitrogenase molybdenum-iron protein alpha/beta subunit
MTLKTLPVNFSRSEGCTLTGALSVTTQVNDAISIVHGPNGCTHHNFSLLYATAIDNEAPALPALLSTGLDESGIVFGGEEALHRTIASAAREDPAVIYVLSTCVVETIGDDIREVCRQDYGVPVVVVPTAGFLGGTFSDGVANALVSLSEIAAPCSGRSGVNLIGEKNLEYEVEENYAEVFRLLSALGIPVNLRFVHDIPAAGIATLGRARLNILREPALVPVGEHLRQRFGTPYVPAFPFGFAGTLSFLEDLARMYGCDGRGAVEAERGAQEELLLDFSDLRDSRVSFDRSIPIDAAVGDALPGIAGALRMHISNDGSGIRVPVNLSAGTTGVRRLLHRWRRAIHA